MLLNGFEETDDTELHGGIGYGGGARGVNAVWEKDFDTGYTAIVLANFDPPAATDKGRAVMQVLQQKEEQ